MFWKRLIELCNAAGKSPNGVCAELGFSNAAATKWKKGAVPRSTTLQRIADYFGVEPEYFFTEPTAKKPLWAELGEEEEQRLFGDPKVLTSKEKRILQAYRDQPEVRYALHRILQIKDIHYVRVYSAANSDSNCPDEVIYMRKDRWDALKALAKYKEPLP